MLIDMHTPELVISTWADAQEASCRLRYLNIVPAIDAEIEPQRMLALLLIGALHQTRGRDPARRWSRADTGAR